jgi:hypothetical protein
MIKRIACAVLYPTAALMLGKDSVLDSTNLDIANVFNGNVSRSNQFR